MPKEKKLHLPQQQRHKMQPRQLERTFRTNIFSFFFHGEGSHETSEKRGCNHQHNFGHCVQMERTSARLFFDQRCNNIFTRSLSQALADNAFA